MIASTALVREAFVSAGEKRFFLARILYRMVFGPDWQQAVLGFAYFKYLDNLVDDEGIGRGEVVKGMGDDGGRDLRSPTPGRRRGFRRGVCRSAPQGLAWLSRCEIA